MVQVLLINPKIGRNRKAHPDDYAAREPLSILVLGSYLKDAGVDVKLIDAVLYDEDYIFAEFSRYLTNQEKPLLIGCSVMTTQISHALKISDFIKQLNADIPVVWGGVHSALFPVETSLDRSVDIVIYGRGEVPLLEVCMRLMSGKNIETDIPGTCIEGDLNESVEFIEMSKYPYLDYELLDLKRYLGPLPHYLLSAKPNKALQIISSRGCPWRCGYCINKVTSNKWTAFESERYLDELYENIKKFKLDAYRVMDEDFFVDKKRAFKIVAGLKKRGMNLTWGANIRANYFREDYVSVDFARELRATGCKYLSLGAESGNQRVLDLITKDIKVDQILNSARVCDKADIIPIYSWMVGIPTQTKEETLDTVDIMLEISRICPTAIHYPFWIFRPFPGGSLYNMCVEEGLNVPTTLRKWNDFDMQDNDNTGFYGLNDLPWVSDKEFVEFLSKFGNIIPNIMNEAVIQRIKAKVIYYAALNWDSSSAKVALGLIKSAWFAKEQIRNLYKGFE